MMTGQQVFDWAVTAVNFLIMYQLFRLVVILPMYEAVRLREQRVKLRFQEIEALAADAKATKEDYQAKFGDIDSVVADLKKASQRSVEQARTKIQERAESEERYMLERAEAEARALLKETEEQIRSEVTSLAVRRAEAILEDVLDASAQNKIVASSVKKVGELSAS